MPSRPAKFPDQVLTTSEDRGITDAGDRLEMPVWNGVVRPLLEWAWNVTRPAYSRSTRLASARDSLRDKVSEIRRDRPGFTPYLGAAYALFQANRSGLDLARDVGPSVVVMIADHLRSGIERVGLQGDGQAADTLRLLAEGRIQRRDLPDGTVDTLPSVLEDADRALDDFAAESVGTPSTRNVTHLVPALHFLRRSFEQFRAESSSSDRAVYPGDPVVRLMWREPMKIGTGPEALKLLIDIVNGTRDGTEVVVFEKTAAGDWRARNLNYRDGMVRLTENPDDENSPLVQATQEAVDADSTIYALGLLADGAFVAGIAPDFENPDAPYSPWTSARVEAAAEAVGDVEPWRLALARGLLTQEHPVQEATHADEFETGELPSALAGQPYLPRFVGSDLHEQAARVLARTLAAGGSRHIDGANILADLIEERIAALRASAAGRRSGAVPSPPSEEIESTIEPYRFNAAFRAAFGTVDVERAHRQLTAYLPEDFERGWPGVERVESLVRTGGHLTDAVLTVEFVAGDERSWSVVNFHGVVRIVDTLDGLRSRTFQPADFRQAGRVRAFVRDGGDTVLAGRERSFGDAVAGSEAGTPPRATRDRIFFHEFVRHVDGAEAALEDMWTTGAEHEPDLPTVLHRAGPGAVGMIRVAAEMLFQEAGAQALVAEWPADTTVRGRGWRLVLAPLDQTQDRGWEILAGPVQGRYQPLDLAEFENVGDLFSFGLQSLDGPGAVASASASQTPDRRSRSDTESAGAGSATALGNRLFAGEVEVAGEGEAAGPRWWRVRSRDAVLAEANDAGSLARFAEPVIAAAYVVLKAHPEGPSLAAAGVGTAAIRIMAKRIADLGFGGLVSEIVSWGDRARVEAEADSAGELESFDESTVEGARLLLRVHPANPTFVADGVDTAVVRILAKRLADLELDHLLTEIAAGLRGPSRTEREPGENEAEIAHWPMEFSAGPLRGPLEFLSHRFGNVVVDGSSAADRARIMEMISHKPAALATGKDGLLGALRFMHGAEDDVTLLVIEQLPDRQVRAWTLAWDDEDLPYAVYTSGGRFLRRPPGPTMVAEDAEVLVWAISPDGTPVSAEDIVREATSPSDDDGQAGSRGGASAMQVPREPTPDDDSSIDEGHPDPEVLTTPPRDVEDDGAFGDAAGRSPELAELRRLVPPGTSLVAPSVFVGLLGAADGSEGVDPVLAGAVAVHSTFRGVPLLPSMVRLGMPGPGAEVLNRAPEEAGAGGAGLARVARMLDEHGGDAVVRAASGLARERVLNLTRVGDEVSVVEFGGEPAVGEVRVVGLAEVEGLGAGLGQVYALVFDGAGQWTPVHPLAALAGSGAQHRAGGAMSDAASGVTRFGEDEDAYQRGERAQKLRDRTVRRDFARNRDVRVPGVTGRLRQTFYGVLWLGASAPAALWADLAAVSKREIIALASGPGVHQERRWWRFRSAGHPLPVRIQDLPPEARAELDGTDVQEPGENRPFTHPTK